MDSVEPIFCAVYHYCKDLYCLRVPRDNRCAAYAFKREQVILRRYSVDPILHVCGLAVWMRLMLSPHKRDVFK